MKILSPGDAPIPDNKLATLLDRIRSSSKVTSLDLPVGQTH